MQRRRYSPNDIKTDKYRQNENREKKYKARIKILVKALTPEVFAEKVAAEWAHTKDGPATLTQQELDRVAGHFSAPAYEQFSGDDADYLAKREAEKGFNNWALRNVHAHKVPGYAAVTLSLKPTAVAPGDADDKQLDAIADLADQFSFGELRVTHQQNLVLADVRQSDLYALWQACRKHGFATPNIGLLTDIICCPGGDFCALANAKSIPIAEAIQRTFDDLDYLHDIGDLDLNISGCMNACGHHHIGNIGILGVDKNGSEWYQLTIGGAQGKHSALGKVIGPAFSAEDVPEVIATLAEVYREQRQGAERFVDTVERIGLAPFKARVYPAQEARA